MTAEEMPGGLDCRGMESGTNNEANREAYQRRQHQVQPEAEYELSESSQENVETRGSKDSPRRPNVCWRDAGADTASLNGKPSQPSRPKGLIEMFTGAVGAIIPGKTRQKDEPGDRQRRPPTPKPNELTEKLQNQAKHRIHGPHEQVPGPLTKERQESDRSLDSRRRLEEKHKQEVATLRKQVHKLQVKSTEDERRLREMSTNAENMKTIVCTLRDDITKANAQVAALGKTVAENEAIITRANATAVSRLAGNVSRELTDDMIREALKKFFQTEFLSWCADVCAAKVEYEQDAMKHFLDAGIINKSSHYWDGPGYLRFDMNTPDGSGPLVLLQAALATRLCELYLSDAYFLAQELPTDTQGRWMLSEFERHLSHEQLDAVTSWRVQTVECLEQAMPITEEFVLRQVDNFVREYGVLLSHDQFDHEARKDLARIFVDFANLALKLWKSGANVKWRGMGYFHEEGFEVGDPGVEVESSLVSTMGQRLNGRPIGLIIQPMIYSKIIFKEGHWNAVVWHKALAWVSGEEESVDSMELV